MKFIATAPKGKRLPLVKHRCMWVRNNTMDPKNIGYDWINLAQGRIQ